MAANTDPRLQNQVIYSIYVRNHTSEGTFRAVIPDLDRIRALGTDIIWLMPIHPIGVEGKKGTLGCPYANRDYRAVNPAYGTMEDFEALVREIHAHGMKWHGSMWSTTTPRPTLFSTASIRNTSTAGPTASRATSSVIGQTSSTLITPTAGFGNI